MNRGILLASLILLSGQYHPAGPVFPASGGTVIYVNTTFNEAGSGTLLAGTTPATCANGCTGTWTQAAGGPVTGWRYNTNSVALSDFCTAGGPDIFCPVYIDTGHSDYTLRFTVLQFGTGFLLNPVVRWTDNANFVTLVGNGSTSWTLFEVFSGTTTAITSGVLGNTPGIYTVVMNGATVTATGPSGSFSGTLAHPTTVTTIGLNANATSTILSPIIVTALSVESN